MSSEINKLQDAIKKNIISKGLRQDAKLLIELDVKFRLIYSSSREQYIRLEVTEKLTKKKAKNLIIKGYKDLYLQLCQN